MCKVAENKTWVRQQEGNPGYNDCFWFPYFFVLELVLLWDEEISDHAHKTVSWYLLVVLFKISHKRPRPFFLCGVSHPQGNCITLSTSVVSTNCYRLNCFNIIKMMQWSASVVCSFVKLFTCGSARGKKKLMLNTK